MINMTDDFDFERYWLDKFSNCLGEIAGEEIRDKVMYASDGLTSQSNRAEVIAWSQTAIDRLDQLVDEKEKRAIMTGCACQYPRSSLEPIREAYQDSGDIDIAHQMLQEQFVVFLRDTLQLDEILIEEIVNRGWGSAGIRDGNKIIASKIPKSGYLVEYMQETDPNVKCQYYCHCPRVRDILKTSERLSPTYCYCGAGYYKGIWEKILQEPVEVEVLESVMQGDEVCKIGIYLPTGIIA
jgi:hypothetical protein